MAKREIMKDLNLELIEQHLEGKLTGNALAQFEKELKENEPFAEEVTIYQNLMEGIEAAGEAAFIAKISDWEKAAKATQQTEKQENSTSKVVTLNTRRKYLKYIGIAASILLLLIPLGWLLTPNSSPDLAQNYFEPYPDVVTVKGETSPLFIGMGFYNQQKYKEAAEALSKYIVQEKNREVSSAELITPQFYLGISQLGANNANNAIKTFKIITVTDNTFKAISEWYLALAYLKAKDNDSAIKQLEMITQNSQHSKAAKATELLAKIKD